ncbi:MAG: hypothetical protein BWY43_00608 [candidate division WS2 bacterium ADurb.Bin280]|uniref:Agmatine deiminase n=1 Tax=candidate division WS2 bacterium ADurb.Bin280 TaxID=1852829 RepID=A0A1V5SD23_9BACT|nr:MAG: hypothetical protein BWY43_00608 [candidate division WS2 bacterium ADurb.Bin280]
MFGTRLILGEPRNAIQQWFIDEIIAPSSEVTLVNEAIKRLPSDPSARMRDEYLAIGRALRETGEEFAIVNRSHFAQMSWKYGDFVRDVIALSKQSLDWPPWEKSSERRSFPRDALVDFGNLCLLDHVAFRSCDMRANGSRIITSEIGGGGKILFRRGKALIAEMTEVSVDSYVCSQTRIGPILELGTQVAILPNPVMIHWRRDKAESKGGFWVDHLDREMTLIEDVAGNLHLLIDSKYQGYDHEGNCPASRRATLDLIHKACEPLEIEVHTVGTQAPYALNLVQTPTNKVIMTSGDEDVEGLVRDLVGDNVITTEIPIEALPVFVRGGIHCLVGEFPKYLSVSTL